MRPALVSLRKVGTTQSLSLNTFLTKGVGQPTRLPYIRPISGAPSPYTRQSGGSVTVVPELVTCVFAGPQSN